MPKVTVIIPTYNRSRLLKRAVISVLNQTYKDFELIIVDDASADDTLGIIGQLKDDRIKIIQHKINMGGSEARNTAIKAANGDYIALLDDDDEWLSYKLEKQLTIFEKLPAYIGLIYSGFSFISSKNGSTLRKVIPDKKGYLFKDILRRNFIGSPTPIIKKECFDKVGNFDEALPSCQDWDMWIRISERYQIDFTRDILSRVYIHGDQISADLNSKIAAREILLKKYHDHLIKYPSVLALHYRRLGILYCLSNQRMKALNYFLRSLKLLPFQKGIYLHIISSLILPKIHDKFLKMKHISIFDDIEIFY